MQKIRTNATYLIITVDKLPTTHYDKSGVNMKILDLVIFSLFFCIIVVNFAILIARLIKIIRYRWDK